MLFEEQVELCVVDQDLVTSQQNITFNSYRFGEWIKLLKMYKHNQAWVRLDEAILRIADRFHLKESFWVTQFSEHLARLQQLLLIPTSNAQSQVEFLFTLVEKSLEHGSYFAFAKQASQAILSLASRGVVRLTLAQAKLQRLVTAFNHRIDQGWYFYSELRKLYDLLENKREQKIRESYHRQLKHHFVNIAVVFDEYKLFEKRRQELDKAKEIYNKVKHLPEDIKELMQAGKEIFENSQHKDQLEKMPFRLRLDLLEAATDFQQAIYFDILDNNEAALSKKQRSMRLLRIAKSHNMWMSYLRNLERDQLPENPQDQEENLKYEATIDEEYNRALASTAAVANSSEKVKFNIKKRYLENLVRRINKYLTKTMGEAYMANWSNKVLVFRTAAARFAGDYKENSKERLELNTYCLDVQTYVIRDKDAILGLCGKVFKNTESKYYRECMQRLIAIGQITDARKLLIQGFKELSMGHIVELWTSVEWFERVFGFLGSILEYSSARMRNGKPEDHVDKQTHVDAPKLEMKTPKVSKQTEEADAETIKQLLLAHKDQETPKTAAEILDSKIEKEQQRRYHSDSNKTLYLNHLPQDWGKQDILSKLFQGQQDQISDVRIVLDHKEVSRGFAYVDFLTVQAAKQACQNFKHSTVTAHISRPPKQYDSDDKTIFLCALPSSVTQNKIRDLVGDHKEHIVQIRLVLNEQQTKGFAYVQLETPELRDTVFKELSAKKLTIDGKKILIRECDSNRMKGKKQEQVVFLQGLAYKATERDIMQYFRNKEGLESIKRVVIPKNDKGDSKGFGFAQFQKFKDFQKALDMKKGWILKREFQILRSDRPIPQRQNVQSIKPIFSKSDTKHSNDESAPKSNDQFRQFL